MRGCAGSAVALTFAFDFTRRSVGEQWGEDLVARSPEGCGVLRRLAGLLPDPLGAAVSRMMADESAGRAAVLAAAAEGWVVLALCLALHDRLRSWE